MATKMKLMKLLQEIRGMTDIVRRDPLPKPTALYLTHLRPHSARPGSFRRRLIVTVDPKDHVPLPEPVKITHRNSPARLP
jgi:hypothetical protein